MSPNTPVVGWNRTAATNGTTNDTPRAKICVFCGSSYGANPAHMEAARQLGRVMAGNDIDLVYGGGTVGLMGEVAKTVCAINGPDSVHGIIPEALVRYERDGTYQTVNVNNQVVPTESVYGRTTVVKDMHTRKKLMAEEVFEGGPGSGFIGLSGGYGTMEEVFEVITWNQLGIHTKGIVLLNIEGYWDGIVQWLGKASEQGFVKPGNENIVVAAADAESAVKALSDYRVSEATFKLQWGKQ
ncbi:lysine decarboxylase-like protein [Metarhizium rileyi]|uniref:Lysine decarboxylase-like protein n=1 Tax=Metarhizium rileyi (strain RCEF 4871) TaxID=1649241 RepID=A0A166XXL5_METRR|nr:lysine decarboxylase-like protein [Metarhizium rileyi RCEF 4871]